MIRFGAEPDVPQAAEPGEKEIKVVLNGHTMEFDQPPVIRDDRTLVPMRAIFEALGAQVMWNGDTRTVTALRPDSIITMQIDSNLMYVSGAPLTLDVPPQLVNDFTMVPVRAVSESLGCKVTWDNDTRTVYIADTAG